MSDECRPVEVDGEIVRVRGGAEMNDADRAAFADVVRAAKKRLEQETVAGAGDCRGHTRRTDPHREPHASGPK